MPPTLSNIVAISAGENYNLALVGEGAPRITLLLSERNAAYGGTFICAAKPSERFRCIINGSSTNSICLERPIRAHSNQSANWTNWALLFGSEQCIKRYCFERIAHGLPIAIITHPKGETTFKGDTVAFNAAAASPSPVNYQWRFNTEDLEGATNSTLLLTNVQFEQFGNYSVIASNEFGVATTQMHRCM